MKLELKNVKLNMAFSEETICFKADLYVEGKKVAYASNDGHGGCTHYNVYSPELKPLLQQAEDYCKTLPSTFSTYGDKTFEIKSTLELWIDEVVYKLSNTKEAEKFEKKKQKNMLTHICYGTDNGYKMVGWKMTIAEMLAHPQGRQVLFAKLNDLKNAGETILNTNIPKTFLELA
jgi:hypothetical protein